MQSNQKKLAHLETLLLDGLLTPAKKADNDTLVCLTEMMPDGTVRYHQSYMQSLPAILRESLMGQSKGYRIGPFKIVALFDIWDLGFGYLTKASGEGN